MDNGVSRGCSGGVKDRQSESESEREEEMKTKSTGEDKLAG